jgi:hypothetical protein
MYVYKYMLKTISTLGQAFLCVCVCTYVEIFSVISSIPLNMSACVCMYSIGTWREGGEGKQ